MKGKNDKMRDIKKRPSFLVAWKGGTARTLLLMVLANKKCRVRHLFKFSVRLKIRNCFLPRRRFPFEACLFDVRFFQGLFSYFMGEWMNQIYLKGVQDIYFYYLFSVGFLFQLLMFLFYFFRAVWCFMK